MSVLAGIGQGASGIGQGASGITSALGDLFGSSSTTNASASAEARDSSVANSNAISQLMISDVGVQQILRDMLASDQGLASIFSEENVAGIFDSSVSAQASGSLLSKLAGEIAKLTAAEVDTTQEFSVVNSRSSEQSTATEASEGLLGGLF